MCVDKVESECNRASRLYQDFCPASDLAFKPYSLTALPLHASSTGAFELADVRVIRQNSVNVL